MPSKQYFIVKQRNLMPSKFNEITVVDISVSLYTTGQRYCAMLQEAKVSDILVELIDDVSTDDKVTHIAGKIIALLQKNDKKEITEL